MATPTPNAQSQAAANLIGEFRNELNSHTRNITEKIAVEHLELKLLLDQLNQRMTVIEGLVANSKKSTTKKSETVVVEGDASATTTPVVTKPFANNRPSWFATKYREEAGFKEKYVTAEMAKTMEGLVELTSKKPGPAKINAEAKWVMNYIRDNNKAQYNEIEDAFKKDKEAHEAMAKPAQQVAETVTPPNEKTEAV